MKINKTKKRRTPLVLALLKTRTLDVSWNFRETSLGEIDEPLKNLGSNKLVELFTLKEKKYR